MTRMHILEGGQANDREIQENIDPNEVIARIINTIEAQMERPIDKYLGACYQELLDRLAEQTPTREFYENVFAKRPIPPGFAVNLIPRALQSVIRHSGLDDNVNPYPHGADNPEYWAKTIDQILKDEARQKQLEEIMLKKDTITTIPQRFAGPHAMINLFLPGQEVSIVDLGCGANYGLKGTALGVPFDPIQIAEGPYSEQLDRLIKEQIKLKRGVGIDRADFKDPEIAQWRNDCRYPSELEPEQLFRIQERELLLDSATGVEFYKQDARALKIKTGKRGGQFDAVVLSTMCYQMLPLDQIRIYLGAERLIKDNGIIIIQDFAEKVPRSQANPLALDFVDDWAPNSYRTYVIGPHTQGEPFEMLRWRTGRCTEVEIGEDFSRLLPKAPAPKAA